MSSSDTTKLCPPSLLEGTVTLAGGSGEQALEAIDRLLGTYDGDPNLHFLRGSVLAGLQRYEEARAAIAEAVRRQPRFAIARFQLGLLEFTSGEPACAAATWAPLKARTERDGLKTFVAGLEALAGDEFQVAVALLKAGIDENQQNDPLNKDMRMLIDAIDRQIAKGPEEAEAVSATHLLLRQYGAPDTRH